MGESTRPTTAVPARPASGKARNPTVQINQLRRNEDPTREVIREVVIAVSS
jgi:hypothetical protein